MIDINEGRTNNYLVYGVFVMLGALISFGLAMAFLSFLFVVSALLFIVAVLLFMATNGLEIMIEKNNYRRYGQIAGKKFGTWISIGVPQNAVLLIHAENAHKGNAPMMGQVATLDTKTLTYDIQITDDAGKQHIVYDFLDYKKAREALKAIQDAYNIPVSNKVAEKLAENQRRRR